MVPVLVSIWICWMKSNWAVFKIPLSFHSTGWFIGIPLLDDYNRQYIEEHNPLRSSTNKGCEHCPIILIIVYLIWNRTYFPQDMDSKNAPQKSPVSWSTSSNTKDPNVQSPGHQFHWSPSAGEVIQKDRNDDPQSSNGCQTRKVRIWWCWQALFSSDHQAKRNGCCPNLKEKVGHQRCTVGVFRQFSHPK